MKPRGVPRMDTSLRERCLGSYAPPSWVEQVLQGVGASTTFADAVLGDLAEEHARRTAEGGALVARCWYAREAFRAVPHLLWNAVRHGGTRGRARAAAIIATAALVPLASLIALHFRNGPPERLVVATGDAGEGLILNDTLPVQLSARVLDAAGHVLPSNGVRYQSESGAAASVTPSGVVACAHAGDAFLRASLGAVATNIRLRCRPVHDMLAPPNLDLVAGGPSQDIPFAALDAGGRRVSLLSGQIAVGDTTLVALAGSRIRGLAPGRTSVRVHVGDHESFSDISVYERALTPQGIRPGQRLAVPIRLNPDEMRQWPIPRGLYQLRMLPEAAGRGRLGLAVMNANCVDDTGYLLCQTWDGASVNAYYPRGGVTSPELGGVLVLWLQEGP